MHLINNRLFKDYELYTHAPTSVNTIGNTVVPMYPIIQAYRGVVPRYPIIQAYRGVVPRYPIIQAYRG